MLRNHSYAWLSYTVLALLLSSLMTPGSLLAQTNDLSPEVLARLRNQQPQTYDETGKPIVRPQAASFVPDEVIVYFRQGNVVLPKGMHGFELNEVQANHTSRVPSARVRALLEQVGAEALRKVVRSAEPDDTLRVRRDGRRTRIPDLSQIVVVTLRPGTNVQAVVDRFEKLPEVVLAQPNLRYELAVNEPPIHLPIPQVVPGPILPFPIQPGDPQYGEQWGLEHFFDNDIDAETAWSEQTGDYSIKIGIFDTGLDYGHPDLGGGLGAGMKVSGGYDFADNDSDPIDNRYHGTHVAGIASALTNNSLTTGPSYGIAGVAGGWGYDQNTNTGDKGAQLVAFKIFTGGPNGLGGSISTDGVVEAILEASDPLGYDVDIFNHSWGGVQYDEVVKMAIHYAGHMDRVVVASKGNENSPNPHYPSDYSNALVLSVGATNIQGNRAQSPDPGWASGKGSNKGNGIDVAAPGTGILSTMPQYQTTTMTTFGYATYFDGSTAGVPISGTSMAAPHVSGIAALLLSEAQELGVPLHPEDVEGIIEASAEDVIPVGYDDETGYGLVNAAGALARLRAPYELSFRVANGGTVVNSTTEYPMEFIDLGGSLSGYYIVRKHTVEKTVSWDDYTASSRHIWCRGANATIGMSAASPNYQIDYCHKAWDSGPNVGLQTYVYELWNLGGGFLGWYPTTPAGVKFAYTIVGIPETPDPLSVSISGPGVLGWKQWGTYTANVTGGTGGTPTYNWSWRYASGGAWNSTGVVTQTYNHQMFNQSVVLKVDVTLGTETASATKLVTYEGAFKGNTEADLPTAFALQGNYPNPFNPTTVIRYAVPEEAMVRLTVFDALGREVARLVDQVVPAGYHEAPFEAGHLPNGVYLYRLEAGAFSETRQMVLMK